MKFVITTKNGVAVTPELASSGEAIDYFVKREIRKLIPSKKEKRNKWLELKSIYGYECIEIKNGDL